MIDKLLVLHQFGIIRYLTFLQDINNLVIIVKLVKWPQFSETTIYFLIKFGTRPFA